jgi:hypothetical protein
MRDTRSLGYLSFRSDEWISTTTAGIQAVRKGNGGNFPRKGARPGVGFAYASRFAIRDSKCLSLPVLLRPEFPDQFLLVLGQLIDADPDGQRGLGPTTYDKNIAALNLIMKEWQRTDLTFAQRITDISSGGNNVPSNKPASILKKTGIKLSGATVFPDSPAAADTFTGGAGQNWFFIDSDQDIFTSPPKTGPGGDHVTQI